MGSFHSTFVSFGLGEKISPSTFEKYFKGFNYDAWAEEGGGGAFQWHSQDNTLYTLTCIAAEHHGVLLQWEAWNPASKGKNEEYLSIGNETKLFEFEDIGDDEFYPIGAFIDPLKAFTVVGEFFATPDILPKSVKWVDSGKINWPEP